MAAHTIFFQTRVANFLHLIVEPSPPFSVMVGSGQRLLCNGIVRQVPLTIQGCLLTMDIFVLLMHGSDIALGVSWLATLGRVVTDYGRRIFEFELNGQQFSWRGESSIDIQPVQLQCLRHLCATDAIATYYHLKLIGATPLKSPETPPAMSTLLDSFEDVFTKPQ